MAAWLASLGVSPNMVSILSMVFALLGAAMLVGAAIGPSTLVFRLLCIGAAASTQLRLIANLLDGVIAQLSEQASLTGRLLNEWPDRVSDFLFLVGFGWFAGQETGLLLGLLAACMAVTTAYVRELGRCVGAPPTFHGPMAKPQRMAVLTVALLIFAAWPSLHARPLAVGSYSWTVPQAILVLIIIGCLVTAVRRLVVIHRFAASQGGNQ
jgi:phosphatidylglycerophosphate synthase